MKQVIKFKWGCLYFILGTVLFINSCGGNTDEVDEKIPQNKHEIPVMDKEVHEENQKNLVEKKEILPEYNKESFSNFLEQSSSLNLKFDVYNQINPNNSIAIYKYNFDGKTEDKIKIKIVSSESKEEEIEIDLNTVEKWQKLISLIKKHPEYFLIKQGQFKVEEKNYKTNIIKDVPPSILISFINNFFLNQGDLQQDKMISNFKDKNLTYPIKLYLILADINEHRKYLSKGFLFKNIDYLNEEVEAKNKFRSINSNKVTEILNRYKGMIDYLNQNLTKVNSSPTIIKEGGVEKRIFKDNFVYIPQEIKEAPDLMITDYVEFWDKSQKPNFNYTEKTEYLWDILDLGKKIDPYKFLSDVNQIEVDEYIKYLMKENLRSDLVEKNKSVLLNNADSKMFNTYLEVEEESGMPIKIKIEYRYPSEDQRMEPIFTANSLTIGLYK